MSKTVEVLGAQHQEVLAYLEQVSAGLAQIGSGPDVAGFARFLEGEVLEHFDLEEKALFPVMARYQHLADGPLAVMNAEHDHFRGLLGRLGAALRAGDQGLQRACTVDLISLLRGHIAKEDGVLFPMALHTLSADELREVDALAAGLKAPEGAPPA